MKATLSTETNNTTHQTPIEIALGIDDEGMTTAKKLYEYLELAPNHYSRWCKKNILNNQYADYGTDYIPFATEGERHNPNPSIDYKLTAKFAKHLSMTGNTEKHLDVQRYFITCEEDTHKGVLQS